MGDPDGNVELTFRALAARRRRIALRSLQTHRRISLADLAELVLERETESDIVDLQPEEIRDVYFSLYHKHIPLLEEAGLASYEQEEDLVSITESTDSVLFGARDAVDSLIR